MSDQNEFSLTRLEHFTYGRHYLEAARELFRLLKYLNDHFGALGEIGKVSSGDALADYRDAHLATRIASAVGALFADPNFHLSDLGFQQFIHLQRWLAIIFGASPLGNADHIIGLLNESSHDNRDLLRLNERNLLKFCLLYSLDSHIPLQAQELWQRNKRLAAPLFVSLLSTHVVISEQAHAKREELLGWLTPKLAELSLDDHAINMLNAIWMHCSYASRPDKHDIKQSINSLIRKKLLAHGICDIEDRPPDQRAKPVIMCILEGFYSDHPVYRTYSVAMEALKAGFHLVGVSQQGASDATSMSIFDERHIVPKTEFAIATVAFICDLAARLRPDIVYYPSVGMVASTICLANLRLAPLQIASPGHPATTHSPYIDYVLAEEDYIGDPECFSETLVALPVNSVPYRPPEKCPNIPPLRRKSAGPVRIAVAASLMKFNPGFLNALRQIRSRAKAEIEFHLFTGLGFGLAKVYVQNAIKQYLPDAIVVHPHLPYAQYLERINACDLFLDPFPFGNTNGIVDTVRQGLPGVCMTGPEIHSHVDEGLFRRLGLPEWTIARTAEEYVNAALRLVDNAKDRSAIRSTLLKRNPDAILFEGNPELFLRSVQWLHQNHGRQETTGKKLLHPKIKKHASKQ